MSGHPGVVSPAMKAYGQKADTTGDANSRKGSYLFRRLILGITLITSAKKAAVTALALASTLSLAGCGELTDEPSSNGIDMNNPNSEYARLAHMLNIDEAIKHYQQMEQAITERLTQTVPELAEWEDTHDSVGRAGCLNEDGETYNFSDQVVRAALPDEKFEQAIGVVQGVVQQFGFTTKPDRFKDSPGKHFASFKNQSDGSSIFFAASKQVVLQIRVGCHLTAEAKQRGHLSHS